MDLEAKRPNYISPDSYDLGHYIPFTYDRTAMQSKRQNTCFNVTNESCDSPVLINNNFVPEDLYYYLLSITQSKAQNLAISPLLVVFYVAPTVFQSYSDFQLVSGGGKPQRNLGETTDLPQASWISSSHDKFLPSVGLELAAGKC